MTPHGVDLTAQREPTQSQQSMTIMAWGPTLGAIRRRFHDIARTEFRKHRKRLGVLSEEQENAIEVLLISAVNKISHHVIAQMRVFD
jgi:glutamyl-tRNA reductase